MEEAERLCDEIMIMNKGEIVGHGDPTSLIAELNGTQQIRLKLETSAPGEELARALGTSIGATWDEFTDSLLIATNDVTSAIRKALALTEQRQIRIVGVQVDRLSLEDVFLNKTGKELKK